MASTPLFKSLKPNGTSFYAFPGAAEDISAAYQNTNYKMYFSKYALVNLPKQNTTAGTQSNPIYFDFDNSFEGSVNATPASNYSDAMIESLRNYVANQEVVIRESRLNNTEYYYDTNALETTSEKLFFKWCKKLNIIDFEPAIPEDEYFSNLQEFQSNNINDDEYFPEFLWKEREVTSYNTRIFYETPSGDPSFLGKLEVEFGGDTNFRVGDIANIYNVGNSTIYTDPELVGSDTVEGINTTVLSIIPSGATQGQRIIFDINTTLGATNELSGKSELVYSRLVQYIGEVNGISNVQEANRSYTEVYANIPDHTGQTPDVLFRTMTDVNYKPNLTFPILPSQYQPEILGSELFNSPIVSTPQNYPGSYFGQFDTLDFTYETETGDNTRRSGDYYGVSGDINNPVVNGSTIDGITMDFNTSHYVKMNIPNRVVTNFDQFNALEVNNEPPKSFEYNAILWYYTVEDSSGNSRSNLYGISFLDHPDNNLKTDEISLRFPTIKKLVANGEQDGTSYSYNLNLNFNIINENTIDAYNPEAINSLFSMNLFNDAMKRLASTNDSFINIIAEHSGIQEEILNIKGLVYTQTDLTVLNTRIDNLDKLIRLYSTNQMVSSESIEVNQIPGSPPQLVMNSTDPAYGRVDNYKSTDLYNAQGIIPINISVPKNKTLLINYTNNDEIELDLDNNDKLTLILDKDLYNKQSVDVLITPSEFSSQNKKLDIYMESDIGSTDGTTTEILLIGDIDLPVFYNTSSQLPNSASLWKDFKFEIDFEQPINLITGDRLEIPFSGNTSIIENSIKVGDTLRMNNFFVGTASIFDFSGQYRVDSVGGGTSSYVTFDISNNDDLVVYGTSASLPLEIHGTSSTLLSNIPYFSLNKGYRINVTRVSNSDILNERYIVQVDDII
jgi:hypothetical protein